jgi:LssY C-terminus
VNRIYAVVLDRISPVAIVLVIFVLLSTGVTQTVHQPTANSTKAPADEGNVSAHQESYTLEMDGSKQWRDTYIDLRRGAKLHITAEGTITSAKGIQFGPEGIPRSLTDLIRGYPVPNGAHGELIGRLGPEEVAGGFDVGASVTYTAPVAGRLYLGINQSLRDAVGTTGIFQVKIDVLDRGLNTAEGAIAGGPAETTMPAITQHLLDLIPRRVTDQNHNRGDMVNILIVGIEAEVVKAFTTAQWVEVDKSVDSTVLNGLLDTLEKKDYLTMPMSALYLFNRPQDYGFTHAEPVKVFMARNHLRVWKSPHMVDGRPLWCVAATHDVGFERDERNNGVTHRIDPAIDDEREYVNQTLSATGLVMARGHVTPTRPVTRAKTATGGEFHSDGRILVLELVH